MKIFTQQTG